MVLYVVGRTKERNLETYKQRNALSHMKEHWRAKYFSIAFLVFKTFTGAMLLVLCFYPFVLTLIVPRMLHKVTCENSCQR
jgi:hypothetical protein